MACTHKSAEHFINAKASKQGGPYVWRCTGCGREDEWSDGWGFLGSVECKACSKANIQAVYCSEACREKAEANEEAPAFAAGQGWQWRPVVSSNIDSIGYDFDHLVLAVSFHNGTTYDYDDVPPIEAEALVKAPSVGTHFNRVFRAKYRGTKRGAQPAASGLPGAGA